MLPDQRSQMGSCLIASDPKHVAKRDLAVSRRGGGALWRPQKLGLARHPEMVSSSQASGRRRRDGIYDSGVGYRTRPISDADCLSRLRPLGA